MPSTISITATESVCALGKDLEECLRTWQAGQSGLKRFGGSGAFAELPVGKIQDRSLLAGRRYGAASNLAVHTARQVVAKAGWTPTQLRDAWIFAGTSRGNLGEILGQNANRRPFRQFKASNTLHSEVAAAVSIELGIRGPWQLVSNGCSSGLDALGLAWAALKAGLTPRALVLSVDLPLIDSFLQELRESGLLASPVSGSRFPVSPTYDPFSPDTTGLLPGEAAAALTLETDASGALCSVETYHANSDAYDALMIPHPAEALTELIARTVGSLQPDLICPHATGTRNHAVAEPLAIARACGADPAPLLPLKPLTGHTLGASGLLDVCILAAAIGAGSIPGCLPNLTPPEAPLRLATDPTPVTPGTTILKIASGMGGHNSAVLLRH